MRTTRRAPASGIYAAAIRAHLAGLRPRRALTRFQLSVCCSAQCVSRFFAHHATHQDTRFVISSEISRATARACSNSSLRATAPQQSTCMSAWRAIAIKLLAPFYKSFIDAPCYGRTFLFNIDVLERETIGVGPTHTNTKPEETAMKAFAAARAAAPYSRPVVRPSCPHCNDVLFAATVSVHVHDNDIRHWWSCETCGHQFMTRVSVARDIRLAHSLS